MTEHKRTYDSKTQTPVVRHLAPINTQPKPEIEIELVQQGSPNQTEKIDLLNRLIKHLKTL